MAQAGELPPRSVCITFDDGKQSDLRMAVPALLEAQAKATFFIIPEWVGSSNILDAAQVRELAACGMEVGSHSLSHPFMTELDAASLEREAVASRQFLENLLGRQVESFSYPFGDVNDRVRQAVARAGYRVACGTRRGRNPAAPDWLLLRRWGVPGSAGVEGLRQILSRNSPTWRQAAVEVVKRAAGTRRFTAWKGRWARRVAGAGHE
jgi:peptidoglycan/xylan/chitin deacetylase (PgdA/CDA1 family)